MRARWVRSFWFDGPVARKIEVWGRKASSGSPYGAASLRKWSPIAQFDQGAFLAMLAGFKERPGDP